MNIYDTNITDEDDALLQVFKHSSIHHAGFIGEDRVYALSHDEVFAIHNLNDPEDSATQPSVEFGDLRPILGCDYVVQVLADQWGTFVAAGKTRLGSFISSLTYSIYCLRPPYVSMLSLPCPCICSPPLFCQDLSDSSFDVGFLKKKLSVCCHHAVNTVTDSILIIMLARRNSTFSPFRLHRSPTSTSLPAGNFRVLMGRRSCAQFIWMVR